MVSQIGLLFLRCFHCSGFLPLSYQRRQTNVAADSGSRLANARRFPHRWTWRLAPY